MNFDIVQELKYFGAVESEIILLDHEAPSLIDYLDLLGSQRTEQIYHTRSISIRPNAVIEVEGKPALYVLRADKLSQDNTSRIAELLDVRRIIACRGDETPLAILEPGKLTVYASGVKTSLPAPVVIDSKSISAQWYIRDALLGKSYLDNSRAVDASRKQDVNQLAIHDLLFNLLTAVSDSLLKTPSLEGKFDEVLSLVGRALFTRFLIDRSIINAETFPIIYENNRPENCFSSAEVAAMTCQWLEENFNGELLPLPEKHSQYLKYFQSLDSAVFNILSCILYRTDGGGQLHLDWGFLDFAHVPVGLLSEVYEQYAHQHFEVEARDESVHYTPHHIAKYVLDQAFEGLTTCNKDEAKVLDPAAGAGVFLVLTLRKLIAERWKVTGTRPNKDEIRSILYDQIRGFDINPHALKLSALSLYLTALELDPDPFPPSALKFKKLHNLVLIPTRGEDEAFPKYPILGSLGPVIGEEYNSQFDIVLGNPPWTSLKGKGSGEINSQIEKNIRSLLKKRNADGRFDNYIDSFENPDKVPDLPFVWRSLEWLKPQGVIAFVLHGRLLFKRDGLGVVARNVLFRAMRVTGILNGAGLESTEVWPGINQPYCLLFGKNRLPEANDVFYYISPSREKSLNSRSIVRVDYQSAQPINPITLENHPTLLKTLFKGNALDAELIDRIDSLTTYTSSDEKISPSSPRATKLNKFWQDNNLAKGAGYQIASRGQDTYAIMQLNGVNLTKSDNVGLLIDTNKLTPFSETKLHRPRSPEIYKPPLVIFNKAPGDGDDAVRARLVLSNTPVIYHETYFGFSTNGHPNAQALASYLFLIANSDFYAYYNLMTSARFGIERRVLYIEDVEEMPIIRFECLSEQQKTEAFEFAQKFSKNELSKSTLNDWVNHIYGLDPSDYQVIRDALETEMPFSSAKDRADSPPTSSDLEHFRAQLEEILKPFLEITAEQIFVKKLNCNSTGWTFFDISTSKNDFSDLDYLDELISKIGEDSSVSKIIIEKGNSRLRLGIVSKYRYLTPTRARICALDLIQNHSDAFPVYFS